jgi:hypothetical protein
MNKTKIGTIFFISIIALAGIGVSYAQWTNQTQIDVTATAGLLSYRIANIEQYDQSPTNDVEITPIVVPDTEYKEWQITVNGAYPGWEGRIKITWENTESIPITFDSFQVIIDSDTDGIAPYYNLKFYYTPGGGDPWSATNMDETLQYLNSVGWITYASLGIPAVAVTVPPYSTFVSVVGLKLSDTLTDLQGATITFRVQHEVTQAI